MVISELDEEVTDFDWFAMDKDGRIGHFTTGGMGALPRTVAASRDDLRLITDFFVETLPASTEASLAPKALAAANNADWRKCWTQPMDAEAAMASCFEDSMRMAGRGLFSFDHAYALDIRSPRIRPCPRYHRIAIPAKPIHRTDLPPEIQSILRRTILVNADFSQDDEVNVEI